MKKAIFNAFKWVQSYLILTCESGGRSLLESDDQNPNGDVVKRRYPLYLAIKDSDDYVVSYLVHPPPPKSLEARGT